MFEFMAMLIVYTVALAMLVCFLIGCVTVVYEIKDHMRKRRRGGVIELAPSDSIEHLDWTVR